MSSIIYQREAPPWKTGGQTISGYDSGLIRVEQQYTVPTKNLASYLETFKEGEELEGVTSPAIDGLYIYATPSWQDQGNGTTSATVTAYGRKYTGLRNLTTSIERFNAGSNITFSAYQITGQYIAKFGEEIDMGELQFDDQLLAPFDILIGEVVKTRYVRLASQDVRNWSPPLSADSYRFLIKSQITVQVWEAYMTDDRYVDINISSPKAKIVGQSNYGQFTELDILGSRNYWALIRTYI